VLGSKTYCQARRIIEPELCGDFRGRRSGVLSCELFFPFFPWLVVSLFADSERALLLIGYRTLWVPFGVL
jgi:hypothetical protein